MKKWVRFAPLCAAVVMIAGACVPPPDGGGGTPNLNPVAVASASPTSGNAPLVVEFDGSDSTDPDGTIASYAWDFGNGTTGTGVTATGNYLDPGVYNAVLTVTDDGGKTGTSSVSVTVFGDGDGDGFFVPADCNDDDDTIFPGAPDPAGDGIDQNCDGIDGEQDAAIFVNANTGANTGTCGTIAQPCASIAAGQSRAVAESKSAVFVAGGTYGKFTVQPGLEVRGGYGQNFQRGVAATAPTLANVVASFDAAAGGPVGVLADGVNTPTTVADLQVSGIAAGAGQPSYSVLVRNSTDALVLDSLTIIGGTGGDGANGANGSGGFGGAAASGSGGQAGFEPGGFCDSSSSGSGGGGAGGGGNGGSGGTIDTNCGVFSLNLNARPGNGGGNGSGAGGGFGNGGGGGAAGTDGLPGICTIGSGPLVNGAPGAAGRPGNAGGAGAGGAPGANGGTGGLGSNGLPGGGGGGGGANDCNIDDAGAGGGGGGAGGARAASAGQGGAAGAPSIGLRLENSDPVLTGLSITLGTGGDGGNGGAGAAGQPGGNGGAGGAAFDRGGAGGNGGNGGTGGASGAGGGGGGGAAIGMSRDGASAPSGTPSFSGGTGGAGGTGGNNGAGGQVINTQIS